MESINQLLSNRVGVANISKAEGNHQRDEDELETLGTIAEFFEEITEAVAENEIKKEKNKAR